MSSYLCCKHIFIIIIIVVTVLCAVFPQLVTWLPTTMAAGA